MDEREQLMNTVLLIVVIGAPAIGVLIMAIGPVLSFVAGLLHWLADIGAEQVEARARHHQSVRELRRRQHLARLATVNDYDDDMSSTARHNDERTQTDDADERTNHVPAPDPLVARLEVDRTREAIIGLLVNSGWSVAEIRAVIKGENAAIGAMIADARGDHIAPYETPIAGRPTRRDYYPDEPELIYRDPA